ncbi:VIT1/CCC1 family predicted Fe2+/Mn2+ transporter [Mycobacterium frederiksbergense]|uniref:VIT1/CCC1 family predicted Fe2+/Mn2+ transporter n=1 Tax=Mycolicibacterium frederiksbergense TaxID=117567 RepID=A0ABT6L7P5_9MYCO|nr:hypothetical protein [Mycolicibacterium frederiksbergense]MDH6198972.1 VIT1/CCC1 family predicted Fe2+/Mn2+ transporter [Mycolicibacterium frederiksbergense]
MTMPIEPTRRVGAHRVSGTRHRHGWHRQWWQSALIAGLALAGAFVAILLGVHTSGQWAGPVASLAGFAVAITVITVAVISWERVVANARSNGLVEPPGPPEPR